MYIDRICFLVFIHSRRDVSLTEADEICADVDARRAEIETLLQQKAIQDFSRTKLPNPGASEWELWLGLTYDVTVRIKGHMWLTRIAVA